MMNGEIKKKWVNALRSGEYKQGTMVLEYNGNFCCLGVLCDIYAKTHPELEIKSTSCSGHVVYYHDTEVLPPEVVEWAWLNDSCPMVKVNRSDIIREPVKLAYSLAELNDSGEYNFEQLANLIEEQL